MGLSLLGYRVWRGRLRGSWAAPWPVARVALGMVFRQKLFWALYALALVNFLFVFAGIYLFSQIDVEALTARQPGGAPARAGTAVMTRFWVDLKGTLQKELKLAGDAETYRNFFYWQGYCVMAVLALAGATVVGNDYRHGSLAFYLARPLGRWHYVGGKVLAVGLFVVLLTLAPALVLYAECSLLLEGEYFVDHLRLLGGVALYGLLCAAVLGVVVVALACGLRRTVPLVFVWVVLLALGPLMAAQLIDRLGYDPRWRLIDLWNNLYVVGSWLLDTPAILGNPRVLVRRQPPVGEAALVLAAVTVVSLAYLDRAVRAVDVVR